MRKFFGLMSLIAIIFSSVFYADAAEQKPEKAEVEILDGFDVGIATLDVVTAEASVQLHETVTLFTVSHKASFSSDVFLDDIPIASDKNSSLYKHCRIISKPYSNKLFDRCIDATSERCDNGNSSVTSKHLQAFSHSQYDYSFCNRWIEKDINKRCPEIQSNIHTNSVCQIYVDSEKPVGWNA